jgi:hypothetical protein
MTPKRTRRPLVTTKNRGYRWEGGIASSVPYGVQHTRDAGEFLTKCGQYASDWPIFWELPFDPQGFNSCPSCAAAIEVTGTVGA